MSKFLEIPDNALTPMCLHKESLFYMLSEHAESLKSFNNYPFGYAKGKEEEIIGLLMEKEPRMKIYYGSVEEFTENFKIFHHFTGSHKYFGTDDEPYQNPPIIYRNLKNEEYICKSDIFPILQNMTMRLNLKFPFEVFSIIAYFLKTQEEKFSEKLEFVRFDAKYFEEIEKELRQEMKKNVFSPQQTGKLLREMSSLTFDECFEKMKKSNPIVWTVLRHDRIRGYLQEKCNYYREGQHSACVSDVHIRSTQVIKSLQNVMKRRPEIFGNKLKITPVILRLFEDGNQKFVIKSEVLEAINTNFKDKTDILETIDMEEVEKMMGGAQKIEFLFHPIRRAKHRAVPIESPGLGDDFVTLAVDALFEFLKRLILNLKVFQTKKFERFLRIFSSFEQYFIWNMNRPYFLKTSLVDTMQMLITDIIGNDERIKEKEVRMVKKSEGFTVEDLKNELKHLGLSETFPEIEEHAEVVYKHVDSVKKEKFLRTCDLFDAIKHCQLICVLQRLPNYKKFLHNQKGCERIPGLKCEDCEGIQKKTSENLEPESSVTQDTSQCEEEEIQKPLKNLEIASSVSTNPQKEEIQNPLIPDAPKCEEKTSAIQKPSKVPKIEHSPPDACETCVETSEHLKKVMKRVEILQNLVGKLRKDNWILEESEIKKTEELNKEKEKNQELQKTILKLNGENEANRRVIQQFKDRITAISSYEDLGDPPLVYDCLICSNRIKSDEEYARCPLCNRIFHSICAYKWLENHTKCPACNGVFP
ncbi:hypothetical protein GCK72_003928 [Caenorhabditis remanei]|uniref:RING-type domain-containing protein n=1 Tax=Caenorhabditis remanei TaxID=31234 RepID=A0A6A5HC58_CAERE|nr:hypothetical protein GCK72_003928 [Caenorhabditis remanei]KAF1763982.1 hypothetical protein GCK72_003928 [Caenorhabditis remanei]